MLTNSGCIPQNARKVVVSFSLSLSLPSFLTSLIFPNSFSFIFSNSSVAPHDYFFKIGMLHKIHILPPCFSKFLGFSTEGLEKEILEFMIKIRKRREKVHSKNMLEKSRFERELKRLECSINYERGKKQKGEMIV